MAAARSARLKIRERDRTAALIRNWPKLFATVCGFAALAVLALTAYGYVRGAMAYVDNGDGYYLYAAHRIAQGAVLYRDVMGTQPPVVYWLGAAVFRAGGSWEAIRVLSASIRALSTLLVFLAARRMFGVRASPAAGPSAVLAALVYTLLPIGLFWDRSFDVNPPLTLITLASTWSLVRFTPRATLVAGLLAALALFTKNLYLPILATTLVFLAVRRRGLLVPYLLGLIGGCAILSLALVETSGLVGLHEAFLGQQSSPLDGNWLVAALAYVAANEGLFVPIAIAGAWICTRKAKRTDPALEFAPWFLAGAAAVLLATVKQGTAGPVFQIAEPAVAILAAYGTTWPLMYGLNYIFRPRGGLVWPVALTMPALVLVALVSSAGTDTAAFAQTNAGGVDRVVSLVKSNALPGGSIVAPPYYALRSDTRMIGDAADTYILAQGVRRGDRYSLAWLRTVVGDIRTRRIPVVLIDVRLASVAALMQALGANYIAVYSDGLPPALHVVVWLPRLESSRTS